jgi:SLT domain-containing protein
VSGTVQEWINQAVPILESSGVPASEINTSDIAIIVQGESGGNPTAQNNSDSNARAGHPSRGLMQTIDSTFAEWAVPGHTNVWNPVDNIVAATRYALNRYHHNLDNVPGVIQVHNGQRYTAGY